MQFEFMAEIAILGSKLVSLAKPDFFSQNIACPQTFSVTLPIQSTTVKTFCIFGHQIFKNSPFSHKL